MQNKASPSRGAHNFMSTYKNGFVRFRQNATALFRRAVKGEQSPIIVKEPIDEEARRKFAHHNHGQHDRFVTIVHRHLHRTGMPRCKIRQLPQSLFHLGRFLAMHQPFNSTDCVHLPLPNGFEIPTIGLIEAKYAQVRKARLDASLGGCPLGRQIVALHLQHELRRQTEFALQLQVQSVSKGDTLQIISNFARQFHDDGCFGWLRCKCRVLVAVHCIAMDVGMKRILCSCSLLALRCICVAILRLLK
mmetsp:Transcript_9884/g.26975  ORF Transcript_9884/g.26975 Transcript_9884/m.26975 type:complete len:247 (-) Transcript_9884:82-822(-)